METRVAVISIIISNPASVQVMNEILHDYYEYLADQVNNWLDGSYVKWNCRYAEEVRKRNG